MEVTHLLPVSHDCFNLEGCNLLRVSALQLLVLQPTKVEPEVSAAWMLRVLKGVVLHHFILATFTKARRFKGSPHLGPPRFVNKRWTCGGKGKKI